MNKTGVVKIELLAHLFGIVVFVASSGEKKRYGWKLFWAVSSDRVWSVQLSAAYSVYRRQKRGKYCYFLLHRFPWNLKRRLGGFWFCFSFCKRRFMFPRVMFATSQMSAEARPELSPTFPNTLRCARSLAGKSRSSILIPSSFATISPQQQPGKVLPHAGLGCRLFSRHR